MKNHSLLPILKVFAAGLFLAFSSGTASAAAQIALSPTTKTFADTATDTDSAAQTFTITNAGDAVLNVTSIGLSGTNSGDFIVTGSPATVASGGGTATFTVKFHPLSFGIKSATLTVNSAVGSPTASLSGNGTGPDLSVTGVTDGSTTTMTNVDLGSTTPTSTRSFTINNPGNAALSISGISGANSDFAVTTAPAGTVAAGGTTTFVVTFQPTTPGAKSKTIQINSDAPSPQNAYAITLTATAFAPEIAVEQPAGTDIADASQKSFGSVLVGSTGTLNFTIKNLGTSNLSDLTITKDGANSGEFSITANPTAPVAGPSGSTAFTVTFTPSASGPRTAAIHIASNDGDEDPFDINLTGTGLAPDIKVESPVGTPITPVTVGGANFGTITVNKVGNLTFTVTNTGHSNLTLSNVSLVSGTAAGFAIKSNLTSSTVVPNGTAEFTLQFSPTTAGSFTGSVSIPTNVTGKNPYVIPFTATG
jgi:hypothetical protein